MMRLSSPFQVQRHSGGGGSGQHLEDSGETVVGETVVGETAGLSRFGPMWHGFSTRQPITQPLPQHREKAQ